MFFVLKPKFESNSDGFARRARCPKTISLHACRARSGWRRRWLSWREPAAPVQAGMGRSSPRGGLRDLCGAGLKGGSQAEAGGERTSARQTFGLGLGLACPPESAQGLLLGPRAGAQGTCTEGRPRGRTSIDLRRQARAAPVWGVEASVTRARTGRTGHCRGHRR